MMVMIRIVLKGVLFNVCDNDSVAVHELGVSSKKIVLFCTDERNVHILRYGEVILAYT